jgi:hypothetical protein
VRLLVVPQDQFGQRQNQVTSPRPGLCQLPTQCFNRMPVMARTSLICCPAQPGGQPPVLDECYVWVGAITLVAGFQGLTAQAFVPVLPFRPTLQTNSR